MIKKNFTMDILGGGLNKKHTENLQTDYKYTYVISYWS